MSPEDAELVAPYRWYAWTPDSHTFYAKATIEGNRVLMHRMIMGAGNGQLVDHHDRNGLNNMRSNLRLASKSQNAANSKLRTDNRTGYRGVAYHRASGLWHARLQHHGKVVSLGYHKTPELAALSYDEGARQYHGEFATLNFPD